MVNDFITAKMIKTRYVTVNLYRETDLTLSGQDAPITGVLNNTQPLQQLLGKASVPLTPMSPAML